MNTFFYKRKNVSIVFFVFFLVFLNHGSLEAQPTEQTPDSDSSISGPQVGSAAYIPREFRKKFKWSMKEYQLPWIILDRNRDGIPDAATFVYEDSYRSLYEVLDIDFDGNADDFAFFDDQGQLAYQVIDSDKNGEIDLWVQVKEGRFVQRFQQDKDGDGLVDVDRIYDKTLIRNR